jgi:TRAP-type uncharacterized transport system substrate-binding protein
MVRAIGVAYANMADRDIDSSGNNSLEDSWQAHFNWRTGSGNRGECRTNLSANGISYDDIDEQRLNFNETADALANGDIAGFWSVGAPTSSILNGATTNNIVMIELGADELAADAANPVFADDALVGGTYTGVDMDISCDRCAKRFGHRRKCRTI